MSRLVSCNVTIQPLVANKVHLLRFTFNLLPGDQAEHVSYSTTTRRSIKICCQEC